jgi:uncharacterized PurR-regulated membrane protein YhhQ (DUF165 family)
MTSEPRADMSVRGGSMVYGILLFAAFVLTVWGANVALAQWGIIPVGFGLSAPAGVFFAGLGFTLRDLLHERAGRLWVVVAILTGAALALFLEETRRFAMASAVAFMVSEAADLAVFEPLRRRSWLGAVALSNTVGLTVDSVIFLSLAFGSLAFLDGQLVGKFYMTAGAIVLLWGVRAVLSRHTSPRVA